MAYKGIISVGLIQAFVIYARQLTRPINELSNQYAQIQTALAGAERVFSIMDKPSEPNAGRLIPAAGDIRGEIELRDVTFSYKEGEPVLKGVNMHVKPGQKIAIVGATGAGKTTIVNLLTRFYDIDSGEILLDGVDIREYEKKELRRNIAIVLQDTVLFSETIGYNIRYGRLDATDDEVRAAAAAANADVFIERLPNGYDTPLSGAGSNLSGGQRQLLSIARAVLADPKILILDEATSNVDTRTEMHIQDAMIALMKNRTSLIIAHRLSTIRDADMIVVIENGVVAESGSHDELIAKRGAYYRLYQKQYAGIAT
jgi:ATP-binding cassette subfamily B protein